MRTAAAILMSAAILVALAASGDTSSNSGGSNSGSAPVQSDTAKSSGDNKSAKPHYTGSQQNAINAANDYLNTAAFSKKGLIEQLSSSAGDKYTQEQAQYAAKKEGLC